MDETLKGNPVVRVVIFFYAGSQRAYPAETFSIDVILSESDTNISQFKKRLLNEGIKQRKLHLGFKNCILALGYSTRKESQNCYDFVESFTNNQWSIALAKILSNPDNNNCEGCRSQSY